MTRPTFDEVAFQLTRTIAQRSTCPRLHTAAVIMTPDHRLVASGYNGSLPGLDHCDEIMEILVCITCNGTKGIEIPLTEEDAHEHYYGVNREQFERGVRRIMCPDCQNDPTNSTRATGQHEVLRGCLIIDRHCLRTCHAEANAIAQAAKYGPSIEGCHIYVLHQPCLTCTKLIVASGIVALHYDQPYTVHTEEQKIADRLLIDSNIKLFTE